MDTQNQTSVEQPGRQEGRIAGGIRRTIATTLLSVGLLVVGGVAVVNAADPSASPTPSAVTDDGSTTTPDSSAGAGSDRTGGGSRGDCPSDESSDESTSS